MKNIKKRSVTVISMILLTAILFSCFSAGAFAADSDSVIETIMTAGTTQAFSEEPVPEEDIQTILQAGLAAESAINQQPWFFVAVTDKDVMAELAASGGMPGGSGSKPGASQDRTMPSFPQGGDMPAAPQGGDMPSFPQGGDMPAAPQGGAPGGSFGGSAKASFGDSPLAIIVYMNENTSSPNPAFDCGLAVQNMYIAAASLGYGVKIVSSPTMTLNGANHDQICEKLGVDMSLTAVAVLLVGKEDNAVDAVSSATTRSDISEKTAIIK